MLSWELSQTLGLWFSCTVQPLPSLPSPQSRGRRKTRRQVNSAIRDCSKGCEAGERVSRPTTAEKQRRPALGKPSLNEREELPLQAPRKNCSTEVTTCHETSPARSEMSGGQWTDGTALLLSVSHGNQSSACYCMRFLPRDQLLYPTLSPHRPLEAS